MGKAGCCCDLPQAQCDLVAELWWQLKTSLVFMCENRTPLPKYKTSRHTLSGRPAVMCIQKEPNPGTATAQPCVSLLAASTPTSTTVPTRGKSVHAPRSAPVQHACLCIHPSTTWQQEASPSPGSFSAPSWVCFNGSSETLPQRSEFMNVTYHSISSTISHSVTMATASLAQFLGLLRSA